MFNNIVQYITFPLGLVSLGCGPPFYLRTSETLYLGHAESVLTDLAAAISLSERPQGRLPGLKRPQGRLPG
jgi:hypothetical protein